MTDDKFDGKSKFDAKCLAEKISTFTFISSVFIWYEILIKVNFVSKLLQTHDVNMQLAADAMFELKKFLVEIRSDENFEKIIDDAKKVAETLGVDTNFQASVSLRRRKIPRQFDYEQEDQPITDAAILFRINFFFCIVDQALASVEERFTLLNQHVNDFKFLYNLSQPQEKNNLRTFCKKLQTKLSDTENDNCDIDGDDLFEEIIHFQPLIEKLENNITKILEFIFFNNLAAVYPNITISLRVLLTLPVSVASAERSFSKLKLIKNYLRSTMTQDRLTSLATISIENNMVDGLDIHEIIKEFASRKARKVDFI